MDRQVKYVLQESELPRHWYNVISDLPSPPPPPLHPGTRQPVGPDDLAPLFPAALIGQEVSAERHIAIPEDVLDVYRLWRPTPLFRARRLEKDLDLMAAADFSVIRVGESTWSTWEPEDGVFDLEWLLPVLDGARARERSDVDRPEPIEHLHQGPRAVPRLGRLARS